MVVTLPPQLINITIQLTRTDGAPCIILIITGILFIYTSYPTSSIVGKSCYLPQASSVVVTLPMVANIHAARFAILPLVYFEYYYWNMTINTINPAFIPIRWYSVKSLILLYSHFFTPREFG